MEGADFFRIFKWYWQILFPFLSEICNNIAGDDCEIIKSLMLIVFRLIGLICLNNECIGCVHASFFNSIHKILSESLNSRKKIHPP